MRNAERVRRTRGKLMSAARELFAARGFGETGTEDILAEAGVTRGALYHHFADKAALFEALCRELSAEAMVAIEDSVAGVDEPVEALVAGSLAWIGFMLRPGVRRTLLVDAPSVLGMARWTAIDREHSFRLLEAGIAAAFEAKALNFAGDPGSLAVLLNGAMNAMVLRLGDADDAEIVRGQAALEQLIRGLATGAHRPG